MIHFSFELKFWQNLTNSFNHATRGLRIVLQCKVRGNILRVVFSPKHASEYFKSTWAQKWLKWKYLREYSLVCCNSDITKKCCLFSYPHHRKAQKLMWRLMGIGNSPCTVWKLIWSNVFFSFFSNFEESKISKSSPDK